MSKGKGLVEPIYIPNTDLSDITPNWELTTKLINELKDHGFNVLPIEQTKVYGTYLKSKVDGDIRDSSKSSTSQASGVIRDNKYITEVLAKISSFDYLISFNEAALYGYHTMGIIQKKGRTLRISPSLMITGLQQTNGINFKSKDMLININNEGYEKCGTCYNTMTIRCNDVPRRITYLSELHGGGGFTNSFDTTDKYLFDYYELSTSLLWEVKEKLKLSGSIKSKTLSE
jgi:hypothetical protein